MERLQKVIARAGIASRRKAEELILEGRVKVNGAVVRELGTKVTSSDDVEVNGVKIESEKKVYHLLYKPRGVISAVTDDKGLQLTMVTIQRSQVQTIRVNTCQSSHTLHVSKVEKRYQKWTRSQV